MQSILMTIELTKLLREFLDKKKKDEIKSKIPKEDVKVSEKVAHIEEMFEISRKRMKTIWGITLFMTVSAFVLFLTMVILGVFTGIVLGRPTYGILFGGLGMTSLFGVIIWKPLDKIFESNKIIQIQDLLLSSMKIRLHECGELNDKVKRDDCVNETIDYILSEMSKI